MKLYIKTLLMLMCLSVSAESTIAQAESSIDQAEMPPILVDNTVIDNTPRWHGVYVGGLGGTEQTSYIERKNPTTAQGAGLAIFVSRGGFAGYNYILPDHFFIGLDATAASKQIYEIVIRAIGTDYISAAEADLRVRYGFTTSNVLFYVASGGHFYYNVRRNERFGSLAQIIPNWQVAMGLEIMPFNRLPLFVRFEFRYNFSTSEWLDKGFIDTYSGAGAQVGIGYAF